MNKVICNFLYYRRHGVCCYMCWQRPGIGKAPSFTLVRIKQQFRAVVLRFLIFFFVLRFVESKDKLDVQGLFLCPGLQCGNKTRDGSREYSWSDGRSWGWNWVRANKTTASFSSRQWWARLHPAHLSFDLFLTPGTALETFPNDCTPCYKKPCTSDLAAIQKSISCY